MSEKEDNQKFYQRVWDTDDFVGKCKCRSSSKTGRTRTQNLLHYITYTLSINSISQFVLLPYLQFYVLRVLFLCIIDHLARFENKINVIPGTQVKIEQDYEAGKAQSFERLEEKTKANTEKLQSKLKIKDDSAELQTRIYFDTVIGQKIAQAEQILYEKEKLLHSKPVVVDTKENIDKFMKSVLLNRHHYVGYAITSGFKSIDYENPETGDTALHLAVRKGCVETVEELLKYKASPDCRNKLGNAPVHDAWMFWNTDKYRTKEARLDQERKTCQILQHLFSYGGFVDSTDVYGQTPLHIACRLGTTQAVKIILSFKGDFLARTRSNLLPAEIAFEFGNEESYRLLNSWKLIRHQLLHLDFVVVWHRFLQDYEAVISANKSAETILTELEMENNIAMLDRGVKEGIQIDDPLLANTFKESLVEKSLPKPWEVGWNEFAKYTANSGVMDLKTQLESLNMKLKPKRGKAGVQNPRLAALAKNHMVKYPDRPLPQAKARLLPDLLSENDEESDEDNHLVPLREGGRQSLASDGIVYNPYRLARRRNEFYSNNKDSSSGQRRLQLARDMALDGKYLKYSQKMTTASSMNISLRTPYAPIAGTEEEGSFLRLITNQGSDFDKLKTNTKKEKFEELIGLQKKPTISRLGAYADSVDYLPPTDRDKLYDSLVNKRSIQFSTNEVVETKRNEEKVVEAEKIHKIDLVNDIRPRYVSKDLLPPQNDLSSIDTLSRKTKADNEALWRAKQGLGSHRKIEAARAELEAAIALNESQDDTEKNDTVEFGENSLFSATTSNYKERAAVARQLALDNVFLKKETVKYGEGRVTTTHNMKGKIEEPWTIIGGRYNSLPGDRTR